MKKWATFQWLVLVEFLGIAGYFIYLASLGSATAEEFNLTTADTSLPESWDSSNTGSVWDIVKILLPWIAIILPLILAMINLLFFKNFKSPSRKILIASQYVLMGAYVFLVIYDTLMY